MKYFLDFEFIEGFNKPLFGKRRHFIDMISVGIACEDGRNYYAISSEYNYKDANKWVQENVIIPMYSKTVSGDSKNHWSAGTFHKHFGLPNKMIAEDIVKFCNSVQVYAPELGHNGVNEFYGYYSDYDWVLLCSLFGRMIDLPKFFPMYCNDLKQTLDEKLLNYSNSDFFTKFHIEKEMTLEEKLIEIKKHTQYPQQENEHNALSDAKFNRDLYNFLQTL